MLVNFGQTVGWIKMKLGVQVGLGAGHIVLDEDPAPAPQRRTDPQFLACVCCGQTAGCIKMPLGTEVGLSPGGTVLDGDPSSPKRGDSSPLHFSAHVLWPNGWMDQDATWYRDRPWPTPHCVRGGPSSPKKGGTAQAVAHLSYC